MMFIWGAIALATFATPVMTDPAMVFNWDAILNAPGKEKIVPLVWASVGVLAIAFAAIPMVVLPRGALATVLGLSAIFVPMAVTEGSFSEWQKLVQLIGILALVPGLLVRHEYTDSLTARVMVTIGVVCTLLPYLVPVDGQILLVLLIKALIEAGSHMEMVIIPLVQIVLVVLCLLVWMPGPATAGAKYFAWAVILFTPASTLLLMLADGHVGDMISKAPGTLVAPWALPTVATVLLGYGGATIIGKQLE
jgi:hypothetical protein